MSHTKRSRKLLAVKRLPAMIAFASAAFLANSALAVELNVDQSDLNQALKILSEQSGAQIVFSSQSVKGFESKPLKGDYDIDEALDILLEGTGLIHSKGEDNVIIIRPEAETANNALSLSQNARTNSGEQKKSDAPSERYIEDIVVTARKRSETLQDVPFAIAALTEERLRETGSTDLESFSKNVAGFSVQNLGPGQSQIAIRGISAGQIVRDQPGVKEQVGVYLDESVISLSLFTPDLDFYDANRIEVLRGPQGTLFGSGSLSGTVRYITNQPSFDGFEASVETTVNYIDEGDVGGDIKGMVNIPISETVAFRGVAYHTEYGGFIDAIQPDGSVDEDVNGGTREGVRLAMKFEPNERTRITPRLIYQEVDIDGYNRVDEYNILANEYTTTRPPVSLGDLEQFTQVKEKFQDEFLLVDLTVEYDFDEVTLTSVTSYTDRDVLVVRDATQLTGSITAQPDILNQPESVYTLDAPLFDATTVEVVTEELRLASNNDSTFQWVAGIFYSNVEREYSQDLRVTGFEAATGIPTADFAAPTDSLFFSEIPYELEQIALFGEVSFDIGDRWNVTTGLRYFDFEESRDLTFAGLFAVLTDNVPGETSSEGFSPRVVVSYDVNDDIQLNGQVSKGFRLGGINDPLNEPLCGPDDLATYGGNPTFDDEELINYELGAKMSLFDSRATFNIAAFYSEINDLQATLDAGSCSSRVIINVPEAISMGIEFELFAHPTDNFNFGVAGSWIDAQLNSTVTDVNGNVLGGIEDGNQLPTSPKFQISLVANMDFEWSARWAGFWNATYQYVGSRYTQIGDQADGIGNVDLTITPIGDPSIASLSYDPELDSYSIANFRIGARDDNWEMALFVNNIFDERAELSFDRERGDRARFGYVTSQPRTIGITTRYNF